MMLGSLITLASSRRRAMARIESLSDMSVPESSSARVSPSMSLRDEAAMEAGVEVEMNESIVARDRGGGGGGLERDAIGRLVVF